MATGGKTVWVTGASSGLGLHTAMALRADGWRLVLFYKSFETSYEYTKIGRITNTKGLKKAVGKGSVTVRFSKQIRQNSAFKGHLAVSLFLCKIDDRGTVLLSPYQFERMRAMTWKCPKCGREFSKKNQDHYCVKPETIDDCHHILFVCHGNICQKSLKLLQIQRQSDLKAPEIPIIRHFYQQNMPIFRALLCIFRQLF